MCIENWEIKISHSRQRARIATELRLFSIINIIFKGEFHHQDCSCLQLESMFYRDTAFTNCCYYIIYAQNCFKFLLL